MGLLRWQRGSCPRELFATLSDYQSLRIRPYADGWELMLITTPEKSGDAEAAFLGWSEDQNEVKAIAHRQYGRGRAS